MKRRILDSFHIFLKIFGILHIFTIFASISISHTSAATLPAGPQCAFAQQGVGEEIHIGPSSLYGFSVDQQFP